MFRYWLAACLIRHYSARNGMMEPLQSTIFIQQPQVDAKEENKQHKKVFV